MIGQSWLSPNAGHALLRRGFTVLEVLVAMVILMAILGGLLSLTRDTLRFTGLTTSISVSVQDVGRAEGYMADTFRSAKVVFTTLTLLDTAGATLVNCQTLVDGRCVAVLVPVVDESDTRLQIGDYDLVVFSVEPIGSRFADVGVPRGFQGDNTLTLIEYRVPNVCTLDASVTCPPAPTALSDGQRTFSGQVGFLLGGISSVDSGGAAVETFNIDTVAGRTLVLTIYSRADSAVGQPFTVRETPVELQVSARGLFN